MLRSLTGKPKVFHVRVQEFARTGVYSMAQQEYMDDNFGTAKRNMVRNILDRHMKEGMDYLRRGEKLTLLKGGAELLLQEFSYVSQSFLVQEKRSKLGTTYIFETKIFDGTTPVGNGFGSSSTWEIKSAEKTDPIIINTAIKIGKKRSFVDAVLSATGSSAFFTQDIGEDFSKPADAGITANQIRYIHALMEPGNIDNEMVETMMHEMGADSIQSLSKANASKLIEMILSYLRENNSCSPE